MSNIIIYGDGLFETDDSHLSDLMNSGVSTIMLWSLHVHANGDLFYNDNLIVSQGKINFGTGKGQINPNLPADLKQLRTGGVAFILFSIGAGGGNGWEPDDYHNIQALLGTSAGKQTLIGNFTALAQGLGLDGFDYDCEENEITVATMTTLTQILTPLGIRRIITFCPSSVPDVDWWLQCMSAIYKSWNQSQPVRWWNLQAYGGADPATFIDAMRTYIKSNPIGVTNPNAFMMPGLDAGIGPSGFQQTFSGWQQQLKLNLQGGFVWNLSEIYQNGSTPKAYAQAIEAGLGSLPVRAAG